MSRPSKLEYDSSLGGGVVLDTHVRTFRYAAGATREIRQLVTQIQQPDPGTKMIFQTLPKHMRRRSMSHHAKRLPHKYRQVHRMQMQKSDPLGLAVVKGRPSRKYRRRAHNLLKEYMRRQRRAAWLETHIWHARRFHMVDKWGYRLAYASCDKTFRACYRASADHCLLQDISYMACLLLQGPLEQLGAGFQRLTHADCGDPAITAARFRSGSREGSLMLFRDGRYPYDCLGRVLFMWRPSSEKLRSLQLWVHPSMYPAVLEEVRKVFSLEKKEEAKEVAAVPHYSSSSTAVELHDLRGKLNRFRLTGPMSQATLQQALHVAYPDRADSSNWFTSRLSSAKEARNTHLEQQEYWSQLRGLPTPAQLPSHMVLALNVDDPRIHRPRLRCKAQPDTCDDPAAYENALLMPSGLADSPLWDAAVRLSVSANMLRERDYCKLREQHATVPGGRCKFELAMQPVPLLLIQRPGSQDERVKRLGYGCGWDVIVPQGYGMAMWLALIMRGARPGGLQQMDVVARESGAEQFEVDTLPGRQRARDLYDQLKAAYFRVPPNKRRNYRKLAVVSPFRPPWPELVRDWSVRERGVAPQLPSNVWVLRNPLLLRQLQQSLALRGDLGDWPDLPPDCLIPVEVAPLHSGSVEDNAIICLPTAEDVRSYRKRLMRHSREPVYEEPLKPDPAEGERKALRLQHKQQLKRLRARRVREKRKQQEISSLRVHIQPANTAHLVQKHSERMSKLWLPEDMRDLYSVRNQCSREVIGYVNQGAYALSEGRTSGSGYVTARGLREWHAQCRSLSEAPGPTVLVRNPSSRQYRLARLLLRPLKL